MPSLVVRPAPAVRAMRDGDQERWDAFVNKCSEATFFHRAGWKSVIERAFGHRTYFLYAESEGRIEGVLPLAQVKSLMFGHSLVSLPFCVYGGIAANTEAARHALHQEAQRLATQLGVGHLEYRNMHARQEAWATKELYVTFRKEISPDDESNMLAIPKKQRAMVRKGIKANLQSAVDHDVERFFAAYSESVHRLGTPVFAKRYFQILRDTFGEDCEILTITRDGRTVSSVLSFYFRNEVLPYYGGGTAEAREVAGNDFMYWELMRRAAARGYTIFDFGRSKMGTGAFDFKKNWGFQAQPLPYAYQLHRAKALPDNNPLNPKYQLFIKLWQHMPLVAANMIGPHIVKNLG
ncbi:peptidoglycan bridge formation protein FemAB [Noviherbaspirillum autotrophicum]|uniref:Peptidoglycan bridge formation protein FemAB n=2 Tax=Noviherbaspirillum autotrophicum TaxID=709839 RepID=A0A0C1Y370_9BURK|nr:peptidoglycan bridge formation protein FemAB [Noviherbaspirillum autotrophicum]